MSNFYQNGSLSMLLGPSDIYELYSGQCEANPAKYLPRIHDENPDDYALRVAQSSYDNWGAKAVGVVSSYIFDSAEYTDNPGQKSVPVRDTSYSFVEHMIVGGLAFIVTMPEDGPRVYACTQATCNEADVEGIAGKLYEFTDNLPWEALSSKHKKTFALWVPDGEGSLLKYEYNADGTLGASVPMDRQALQESWISEDKQSFLAKVAKRLVQIYRLESRLDAAYFRATQTLKFGPMVADGTKPVTDAYVQMTEGSRAGEVIHGALTEELQRIADRIKEKVLDVGSILGLDTEFSQIIKVASGISKIVDMLDTRAMVKYIAESAAPAINEAYACWQRMKPVGGAPSTVVLTGEFHPLGLGESIDELERLAAFVDDPVVRTQCKIAAVNMKFKSIPPAIKAAMLKSIETTGPLAPRSTLLDSNADFSLGGGMPAPALGGGQTQP